MAVVYSLAVRNARLQVVANAIDAGGGGGLLNIGTAGMGVILSTIVLNSPCGVVAGGVLTFAGTPLVDLGAAAGGIAAEGQITDSVGTVVISGLTVGLAGANMIISQINVSAGDIVTLLAGSITGN